MTLLLISQSHHPRFSHSFPKAIVHNSHTHFPKPNSHTRFSRSFPKVHRQSSAFISDPSSVRHFISELSSLILISFPKAIVHSSHSSDHRHHSHFIQEAVPDSHFISPVIVTIL
ncbi:hypothetical protein AVEN_141220-1, partial [Araneus ventricosus]